MQELCGKTQKYEQYCNYCIYQHQEELNRTCSSADTHYFCATPGPHYDARRVYLALPQPPLERPAAGWPVYLDFAAIYWPMSNGSTCGHEDHEGGFGFPPFVTPNETMARCANATRTINASGHTPPPPTPGHYHHGLCDMPQMGGAMWDQRLKQKLLGNGVAVMMVNPRTSDQWDFKEQDWAAGADRKFLNVLFTNMSAGGLGPLDTSRMIFRGWSAGAQMVSRVIQALASGDLANATVRGGIFLSGGSYLCYADPQDARGMCKGCDDDQRCFYSTNHSACPSQMPEVCCNGCCPEGFAEAYYNDGDPSRWASHPPAFLAQMSTVDSNADLCAAQKYHAALTARNVSSTLMLVPPEQERCYCVSGPDSPVDDLCDMEPTFTGCFNHTQGFADMVDPLLDFCVAAVSA